MTGIRTVPPVPGSVQDKTAQSAKFLIEAHELLREAQGALELARERYAQACVGFGQCVAPYDGNGEDRRYAVGNYVVKVDRHTRSMGFVQGITIEPIKIINLGD